MPSAITYGDQTIPYRINLDERRTTRVAIHVDPDGSVVVDAPPGFDEATVHRAVQKRARWVANHVDEVRKRYEHVHPREYVSGEQVLYQGRRYILKVTIVSGKPNPVRLRGNQLIVETRNGDPDEVRDRVRGWYREKARIYFGKKISELAKKFSWIQSEPPLRLLKMKKQWGSCSASGQVILNPNLVKAPPDCIEYVVFHELAHLLHHDHGPEFWKLIERHSPNWREAKRRLDFLVEVVSNE